MAYSDDVDFLIPETGEDQTLLHLLDRLLDAGIVLSGDVRVSIAGVDLLYVGLKLLLSSVDTAERYRLSGSTEVASEDEQLIGIA